MTTHAQVMASLQKRVPYLQSAVHREIADGLKADGLVEDGNGGPIHAAAEQSTRLRSINAACADSTLVGKLSRIVAFAQHRGVSLPTDKVLDVHDLNKLLEGSRASIDDRMTIKNELYLAGCLPR